MPSKGVRVARLRWAVAVAVVLLPALPALGSSPPAPVPRTPRPPRSPRPVGVGEEQGGAATARPRARRSNPRALVVSRADDRGRRMVALTLDDGFRPDPRILDLIDDWELRGTAFLVGSVARSSPWLVRRLVDAGWEVCSHTYSHRILTGLGEAEVEREIARGAEAVAAEAGWRCPYVRPPGGAVDATVIRVARALGLTVVNWSASLSDSTSPSTPPSLQVAIALHTLQPGGILLGHFGGVHTYPVLREVLETIFARGWRVGTVTDLLSGRDVPPPVPRAGGLVLTEEALPAAGEAQARARRWDVEAVPPGGWMGGASLVLGLGLVAGSWVWTRLVSGAVGRGVAGGRAGAGGLRGGAAVGGEVPRRPA